MADDQFTSDLVTTLARYVDESETSDARKAFIDRSKKFWKLYRQEEWWIPSEEADAYEGDRPVSIENILFPTVETLVSVFLKNVPTVQIEPFKPSDYDLTHEQNKHITYAMRESGFIPKLRDGSRNCWITGMQLYQTGWDASKTAVYGNGECNFQAMPHEDVFLDPLPGLSDVQQSRYVIFRYWRPIDMLLEKFGDAAAEVLGFRKRRGRPGGRGRYIISDEEASAILGGNRTTNDDEDWPSIYDPRGELLPLYECWFRSTDPRDTGDSVTNEALTTSRFKVAYLLNGSIVREAKPNPFRKYKRAERVVDEDIGPRRRIPIGHGEVPLIRQVAYAVKDEHGRDGLYQAMGVLEQLEALQWDINDLSRQMMINARTIANPPVIVNQDDLVYPNVGEQVTLYPGAKFVVSGNRPISETIRIENPGSIPAFTQYLHQQKHLLKTQISGVKEFVAGDLHKGTSHTTAEGTSLVSEASFSMMWTLIQNMELAMEGVVRHFSGLMQLFYRPGRYTNLSMNGEAVFTEWTSRNAQGEFDYTVISGTSTPLQDVERIRHLTFALQVVQPVLENPTPDNIRIALMTLESSNLPWTYEFVQYLRKRLEEVEQQEQLAQQSELLLAAALVSGGGGPLGPGQPAEDEGTEGVALLAQELGTTPDALIQSFAA